jgi:hypothetical protein
MRSCFSFSRGGTNVCCGSFSEVGQGRRDVRFLPVSDQTADIAGRPVGANRRHRLDHDSSAQVAGIVN